MTVVVFREGFSSVFSLAEEVAPSAAEVASLAAEKVGESPESPESLPQAAKERQRTPTLANVAAERE